VALSPDDPRPPYLQIADDLRSSIRKGELPLGAQLPSVRDLAERYGVARNTVASAIRQLRDERLVVSRQGSGAFVRSEVPPEAPAPAPEQMAALMAQVADVVRGMERLTARVTELERLVRPVDEHR
jgi:DNA-binding GntR family transcriptional regulator